eukprot:220589_1
MNSIFPSFSSSALQSSVFLGFCILHAHYMLPILFATSCAECTVACVCMFCSIASASVSFDYYFFFACHLLLRIQCDPHYVAIHDKRSFTMRHLPTPMGSPHLAPAAADCMRLALRLTLRIHIHIV